MCGSGPERRYLHVGTRPGIVNPHIFRRPDGRRMVRFRAGIPVATEFRSDDDELDGRDILTNGDEPAESTDFGPCANREQLLSAQASLKTKFPLRASAKQRTIQ